ncbi:8-oxo-dGDP phosphatase NUDT18 [Bagarius yarrelli]|uniref:8-oxo-dGDP phosphatase NUDT18 n=1 Tax=Bagarius yarrelli TaxID=175774 RepID=A0A556VCS6_BAGYA|nr:8-oxo-dGDP phosphatase NUDT18 [Bagarius yarrelli]
MDSVVVDVEERLEKMLKGDGLEVPDFNHLQAVTLKKSVCYIVSAVIFNPEGKVLMVQEAKRECYGRWYLPAGRMEEGESIHEALRREVKEEAGFECEPITMLLVQEQGRQWIRFAFLAEVTGGSLKTPSKADSESLQAQWWDREPPLPLRSRDILCLIEAGVRYRQNPWFPVSHPVNLPCPVVCQRLLLIFSCKERLWLLLAENTTDSESRVCFPVTVSEKGHSIKYAGNRLVQECMRTTNPALNVTVHGILGLQHDGRVLGQTDGICFNTLVSLESSEDGAEIGSSPPLLNSEKYVWCEVTNQSLKGNILKRIKERSFLPITNNP